MPLNKGTVAACPAVLGVDVAGTGEVTGCVTDDDGALTVAVPADDAAEFVTDCVDVCDGVGEAALTPSRPFQLNDMLWMPRPRCRCESKRSQRLLCCD